ncbi:hypothetical protein, partial [Streptomyces tricolor]
MEVLQESAEDFGGEGWLVGWWGVGGEVLFEFVQGAWSVGEEGEDGFQQGGAAQEDLAEVAVVGGVDDVAADVAGGVV